MSSYNVICDLLTRGINLHMGGPDTCSRALRSRRSILVRPIVVFLHKPGKSKTGANGVSTATRRGLLHAQQHKNNRPTGFRFTHKESKLSQCSGRRKWRPVESRYLTSTSNA